MLVVAVVGLVVHEYKPQGHEPFYKIPLPSVTERTWVSLLDRIYKLWGVQRVPIKFVGDGWEWVRINQ